MDPATKSDEFLEKIQRAFDPSPLIFGKLYSNLFIWIISIIKKLQYNFPKMRGGGSKAVWNFSKNSSDLVAGPFPMESIVYDHSKASDGILQYPPRS